MLRDISRVWTVHHKKHSHTHTSGMVLEPGNWAEYDPFLLLAEDWFERGTFDFHPHRGMETVTYVMEGTLEHKDNHGGKGLLKSGDVQWMTAGSGIIHAEEPLEGETVHSLQLWVNLPSEHKMVEPRYQDIKAQNAPIRKEDGVTIRIFSGSSMGLQAKTENIVPITMLEITLEAGASVIQDLPGSFKGFFYVLDGEGYFGKNNTKGSKNQVLWLGDSKEFKSSEVSSRTDYGVKALLYAGEPIGELVVAKGPFVMNTDEEIKQAYADYFAGKFNKETK